MKKLYNSLIIFLLLVFLITGFSLAEYTPLPGVLSPDEVDFGGKTVTIFSTAGDPRSGEPHGMFDEGEKGEGIIEKAEKLFNVNIEFDGPSGAIDYKDWSEQYTSRVLSKDSEYDIWGMNNRLFPLLVTNGLLKPVDDYLPESYYENMSNLAQAAQKYFKYQNQNYMLPMETQFSHFTHFTFYNKEVIEALGLEDPYSLYKRGEWTYDAMIEIASEVTRDTTGDGEIDQFGACIPQFSYALGGLIYTNQAREVRIEDDKYVFAMDDPEMIETLNLFPRLQEKDAFIPFNWATIQDQLVTGEVGMVFERIGVGQFANALKNDNVSLVPLPRGPNAEEHIYPFVGVTEQALPINAAEPEKLIALQSYLFRQDTYPTIEEFLIESDSIRTEEEYMLVKEALTSPGKRRPLVFGQTQAIGSLVESAISDIVDGKSPTVAINEIKEQAQAILDDVFNNEN